jgi:hypothetical protein
MARAIQQGDLRLPIRCRRAAHGGPLAWAMTPPPHPRLLLRLCAWRVP